MFDGWNESSEHAYQAKKAVFHKKTEALREIRQTRYSKQAMQIGQAIKTSVAWKARKEEYMLEILRAKAAHSTEYRNRLLQASPEAVFKERTNHRYWGALEGGQNKLGHLHKVVQLEILEKQQTSNQSQQPQKPQKNKRQSVLVIGDSNLKGLNPSKMTRDFDFNIMPAFNTDQLKDQISKARKHDAVVVHTGTNDIKTLPPKQIAECIAATAKHIRDCGSKVVVSKLLPREGTRLHSCVMETNYALHQYLKDEQGISFTNTDAFLDNQRPNTRLFQREYRDGLQLPLLHLNPRGAAMLGKQIQEALFSVM